MDKDFTREQGLKRASETATAVQDTRQNGKPAVRYASDEQFSKAHKKALKTHAGLFRRLAQ